MRSLSVLLSGLTFAFAILSSVNAEKPFDFATTPGKLPKEVVPEEYAIRIAPDLKKLTFTGSETVKLNVRKPVRELVLNALELQITSASVDEKPLPRSGDQARSEAGNADDHAAERAAAGAHTLALTFSGQDQSARTGTLSTRAIRSRERARRKSCSGRNSKRPMRAACFPAGMSRASARAFN